MSEDLRLDCSFADHPKVLALEAHTPGAALSLIRLWSFCRRSSTRTLDGSLAGCAPAALEAVARWPGERGEMLAVLIAHGLVDEDLRIHDWSEHQPWATGAPRRAEQARRAALARWGVNTEQKQTDESEDARSNARSNAPSMQPALLGAMLPAMREHRSSIAPSNAPSPSPSPSPIPDPDPDHIKENPTMPRRTGACAQGRPPARAADDPRERRQGTAVRDTMPQATSEAIRRRQGLSGEALEREQRRQADLARRAREEYLATRADRRVAAVDRRVVDDRRGAGVEVAPETAEALGALLGAHRRGG